NANGLRQITFLIGNVLNRFKRYVDIVRVTWHRQIDGIGTQEPYARPGISLVCFLNGFARHIEAIYRFCPLVEKLPRPVTTAASPIQPASALNETTGPFIACLVLITNPWRHPFGIGNPLNDITHGYVRLSRNLAPRLPR